MGQGLLLAVGIGGNLEESVPVVCPSPVDVVEVAKLIAVDDELVSVATTDDRALLGQFIVNHVLPLPFRHEGASRHLNAVAVVTEEADKAEGHLEGV